MLYVVLVNDESITNVGLILTKAKVISALHHKSKFKFQTFWKKSNFWVFML